MKKLFLFSIISVLALATVSTGEAKDKKDSDRGRHRVAHVKRERVVRHDRVVRRDRVTHVESRHVVNRYHGSRTRNIYVIEHNRPVERVVYIDDGGRYYRWIDGERVYVRERYYDSYPTRYYYRDGRPRVNIHFSL
jgi:hypothetical protein